MSRWKPPAPEHNPTTRSDSRTIRSDSTRSRTGILAVLVRPTVARGRWSPFLGDRAKESLRRTLFSHSLWAHPRIPLREGPGSLRLNTCVRTCNSRCALFWLHSSVTSVHGRFHERRDRFTFAITVPVIRNEISVGCDLAREVLYRFQQLLPPRPNRLPFQLRL
jgi:hypothetical protein